MRHIPRLSPAMAVALAALVLAATGGAVAAVGDGGTIDACVTRTGEIRLLEVESSPPCAASETPITWNLQGPKGDPGEPGARRTPQDVALEDHAESTIPTTIDTKPKGLSKAQLGKLIQIDPAPGEAYESRRPGTLAVADWFQTQERTRVIRLPLPKGRWVVNAKADANQIPNAPDYPSSFLGRIDCLLISPKGGDRGEALQGTVALQLTFKSSKPSNVEVHCTGWGASVSDVRVAAIRVGKLTQYAF